MAQSKRMASRLLRLVTPSAPTAGQVPIFNADATLSPGAPSGGTTDATTAAKGVVQLAGDLAGTAAAPTVPGLASKAPLASPGFTGTPTAPTPTAGDSTTKLATTSFVGVAVSAAVSALLNGAGTAYDTLKEIGDKLTDDDSVIAGILTTIAGKAAITALGPGSEVAATTATDAAETFASNVSPVVRLPTFTADRTKTLPLAAGFGVGDLRIEVGNLAGFSLTLAKQGSDTIQGLASLKFRRSYTSILLASDGSTAWRVISSNRGRTNSIDPASHGFKGWSCIDPANLSATTSPLASGTQYGARFRVTEEGPLTAVGFQLSTAATSPTHFWCSIFDADGNFLGVTADSPSSVTGATGTGSTGYRELALASPTRWLEEGEEIIVGPCYTGGSGPVLIGNSTATLYQFGISAAPYRWATYGTSFTTAPPTSITPSSGVAAGFLQLIGVK